jgi:hypothetical protein
MTSTALKRHELLLEVASELEDALTCAERLIPIGGETASLAHLRASVGMAIGRLRRQPVVALGDAKIEHADPEEVAAAHAAAGTIQLGAGAEDRITRTKGTNQ